MDIPKSLLHRILDEGQNQVMDEERVVDDTELWAQQMALFAESARRIKTTTRAAA